MALYDYKCSFCGQQAVETTRTPPKCEGCKTTMGRVFSVNFARASFDTHFNHSLGKPISSMREYDDELKRKGEREGKVFTRVEDINDAAFCGATEEGLDATKANLVKEGKLETKRYFH